MDLNEIQKLESKVYANTFNRLPVAITHGKGIYLYDVNGIEYLDMFAGIAVNSLGHCHPEIVETVKKQSETLMHTSNWLYTIPQLELSEILLKLSGMEKVFITNDGTEAVETAIKLARKATGKKEIIAMENAFHGRTLGSLSLTWGERYRKPFEPLIPKMRFVRYNDTDELRREISEETSAVILEPIQGESGVIVPDENYLKEVRELTEENGILLILDEVQTGFGRTGKMFAFEHSKIKPDILCLAKGLGGGFPIGATLFKGMDFEKGEHGGTFIGNPLACAVAKTVIDVIIKEDLVKNSERIGNYLLRELRAKELNVRGKGLMIGIESENAERTVLDLIKEKVLTIYSGNIVRILPPLIIKKEHADKFLESVSRVRF